MKLTITINMDNAAFTECNGSESARILRQVANMVEDTHWENSSDPFDCNITLRDVNGNTVGKAKVTK